MQVTSSIPGRVRFRIAPGQSPEWALELQGRAEEIPGVSSVEVSAKTGSILLRYDAALHTPESLAEALHEPLDSAAPSRRSWKLPLRLGHPVIMLGSLALTVGSALTGRWGIHLFSGTVLAGGLVEHAAAHRDQLLSRSIVK